MERVSLSFGSLQNSEGEGMGGGFKIPPPMIVANSSNEPRPKEGDGARGAQATRRASAAKRGDVTQFGRGSPLKPTLS